MSTHLSPAELVALAPRGRSSIDAETDFIKQLYYAAACPEQWPVFLNEVLSLFEGCAAFVQRSVIGGFEQGLFVPLGISSGAAAKLGNYFRRNVFVDPFARIVDKPSSSSLVGNAATWRGSDAVRTCLISDGIAHALWVTLVDDHGCRQVLAVFRGHRDQPFSTADGVMLARFIPHLKRAMALQDRIVMLERHHRAAAATLDLLAASILVVDGEGRVQHANRAGASLLRQSEALHLVNGRLSAATASASAALQKMIRAVSQGGMSSASLPVERLSGETLLWLRICPIDRLRPGLESPLPPGGGLVAIVAVNPDDVITVRTESLQQMYGLTRAEAKVASHLVRGLALPEVAAALGVQVATCRNHLKSIYDKVGVNRQAALIQRIVANAPWLCCTETP